MNRIARICLGACLCLLPLLPAGCETGDEFDHDPPAGQGTLYVDNGTLDDFDVFVDGAELKGVDDGDYEHYDLEPGVHRVVLAAEDERYSFADDIDILEGRRTIVRIDGSYNASVYFDD